MEKSKNFMYVGITIFYIVFSVVQIIFSSTVKAEIKKLPESYIELKAGESFEGSTKTTGTDLWFKIVTTENTYSQFKFLQECPDYDVEDEDEDDITVDVLDADGESKLSSDYSEYGTSSTKPDYISGKNAKWEYVSRKQMFGDNACYYVHIYAHRCQQDVPYTFETWQENFEDWEKEPNKKYEQKPINKDLKEGSLANEITIGKKMNGLLWRRDKGDWFTFVATETGTISLTFDASNAVERNKDGSYGEVILIPEPDPYMYSEQYITFTEKKKTIEYNVEKGKRYYIEITRIPNQFGVGPEIPYSIELKYSSTNLGNAFDYIKDTWGFKNLTTKIPRGTYKMFFDEAQTDEMMKGMMSGTEGHCFGMALTTVCSYLGRPLVTSYGLNNTCLNVVDVNSKSTEIKCRAVDYIDAAFIFQDRAEVQEIQRNNTNDLYGLLEAIRNFEEKKGNPPIIAVFGGEEGGHAILGLSIENETPSQVDILVYDCNYPNQKKYLIVNKENDEYTGWSYNIFDDGTIWSSTQLGAHISYLDVATIFMEKFNAGVAQTYKAPLVLMRVHTNSGEVYYKDTKYDLSNETELWYTDYVRYIEECQGVVNKKDKKFWLKGDSSEVKFENLAKDSEVSLSKGKLRIAASSSDVSDISIDLASQSVSVDDGENATFDVCYSNFSDYYNVNKFDITGDASGKAEIKQNDGAIVIKGVEEFSVNCNSERYSDSASTQKFNEIKTSVKELDKDATYQIIETQQAGVIKLSVNEDKDGDGVFEKTVATAQTVAVTPSTNPTAKPVVNTVPKSTSLSKVTAKSKSAKVTWKKQTSNVVGYQIQYADNKKFSKAKTVNISKNKTTSTTVKKLKAGKKYYFRIRTYNKVSGKKVYSAWSKAKNVKIKK